MGDIKSFTRLIAPNTTCLILLLGVVWAECDISKPISIQQNIVAVANIAERDNVLMGPDSSIENAKISSDYKYSNTDPDVTYSTNDKDSQALQGHNRNSENISNLLLYQKYKNIIFHISKNYKYLSP